jgi:hypothetical protein
MIANDRDLVLKSAALARAAPREWSEFLAAMQGYTDRTVKELVASPPEILQVNQGRLRMLGTLLDTLVECKQAADKFRK